MDVRDRNPTQIGLSKEEIFGVHLLQTCSDLVVQTHVVTICFCFLVLHLFCVGFIWGQAKMATSSSRLEFGTCSKKRMVLSLNGLAKILDKILSGPACDICSSSEFESLRPTGQAGRGSGRCHLGQRFFSTGKGGF